MNKLELLQGRLCPFFSLFFHFLRTTLTIVIIIDYVLSAWQWTDAPPVDADFQPSLRSFVLSDSLMIITGLLELWDSLVTLFGMIRELCLCSLFFVERNIY
jgi:hypothetical protein